MAQVSITQLPQAQALTGTESVPIVQGGVTVQTTTGAISGAGALNYPFLTVGTAAGLPEARYLSTGAGLSLTDNGVGDSLRINLTGAALSLNEAGTGIVVKTGSNTVTGRSFEVGAGLLIENDDGVTGNPKINLGTFLSNFVSLTGTGMLAIQSGTVGKVDVLGTANQIDVTNGDGSDDITLALADNPVLPGTGAVTIPVGTSAEQPAGSPGELRYNSTTETFDGYSGGAWRQFSVAGGVTSFSGGETGLTPSTPESGAIVLDGVLEIAHGGTGQTTANAALNALLPDQTGNAGLVLKTDGTDVSWGEGLPDQTGHSGEFLTTDGTTASWAQITFATPTEEGLVYGSTPVEDAATVGGWTPFTSTYLSFGGNGFGWNYISTAGYSNWVTTNVKVDDPVYVTIGGVTQYYGVVTELFEYSQPGYFYTSFRVTNPENHPPFVYGPAVTFTSPLVVGGGNAILGYNTSSSGAAITAIGYEAGSSITTGTNLTVVGYKAEPSSATATDEATFGNSDTTKTRLFGALAMDGSSTGTSGQFLASSGSSTAPVWSDLDVTGLISGTANQITVTPDGNGVEIAIANAPVLTGPVKVLGENVTSITPFDKSMQAWEADDNSFQTVYVRNINNGSDASADYVAYNDASDVNSYFIDMGMNSSNFTSVDYPIFTPNSGYVFTGGGSSGQQSDLFIGTSNPDSDIILFVGGVDPSNQCAMFKGTSGNLLLGTSTDTGYLLNVNGTSYVDGAATFGSTVTLNADPVTALEAATKQYVDNAVSNGFHVHTPVLVATTGNLTATYSNGTSGVGATLTNSGTQAAIEIDGVSLSTSDRVLVWSQSTQAQNGVYTVTTVGDGSTNWVLTRASDADTYAPQSDTGLGGGDYFFVESGSTYGFSSFVCTNDGTITFGTTAITFQLFSTVPSYNVNAPLSLVGNTLSLSGTVAATNGGTGTNTVAVGDLLYGSATDTWSKLALGSAYKSLVINASGTQIEWNAVALNQATAVSGQLGVANGGTSFSGYTTGDMMYASNSTTLSKLAIGTSTYILTSSGSAPQWSAPSAVTIGTATNLAGGAAGSVPYQTGAGATSFLSLGTTNYVLTAGASAPQYVAQSTLSVGSATNATNATNTAITADSTNATNYLTFVSATTGNLPQLVNSSITCNPSTGQLTGGIAGGSF